MSKMNYEMRDGIARITLDDGKVNVMNWDFFNELNGALDKALSDQAAVLIFTGRPGIFSAGLDLKLLPTQSLEEQVQFQKTFATTMLRVYQFPVPTIAAYRGHAIAGGFILSCACDRFMIQDGPFKMQMNEVVNGMMIPSWISLICRSSIPNRWWREVLLLARAYTPREAFDRQIPDTLVEEKGDVLKAAYEAAEALKKASGPGYTATKQNMLQEGVAHAMNLFEKELLEWRLR
jgi:enoyl-CoA hydratase